MKKLTKKQQIEILSNLYWDSQISAETAYDILHMKPEHEKSSDDEVNLYQRMLTTLDWYTILSIMPPEKLRFLLSDNVIQRVFPKTLQKKYQYVRSVLCQ